MTERRRVIFITGMSGAGQSTSLKILEDLGYEALDNLPIFLLPALLTQTELLNRPIAVRIDARTRDFSTARLLEEVQRLRMNPAFVVTLVFFESDDDALLQRFTETRRRHPFAVDRPVTVGMRRERQLFAPLVEGADLVIDTTDYSIHDLKRRLAGEFPLDTTPALQVSLVSFSYRHGLPREADLVFDVRFLRNPHYDPALRPLTGSDPAVGAYVAADTGYASFFDNLSGLVLPLIPRYRSEGKSYLTIAIGCTGGRHRSVFVAEELGRLLAAHATRVIISHRDIARAGTGSATAAQEEGS